MNCACVEAMQACFGATAALLRKVRRARRFDRVRASRPLAERVRDYWNRGIEALFAYMDQSGGWDKILRHTGLAQLAATVRKDMTDEDRRLLLEILSNFGYFDDVDAVAAAIVRATRFDTFEQAAQFALGQLGVRGAAFQLRNERIRELLMQRKSAEIFATRSYIERVMETIMRHFHELGRNPYDDREFLADLKRDLNYAADWQAKRFALTETAIAAEMAQIEVYRRSGVRRKQWNILGLNTRPTHMELSGVEIGIEEKYYVGGYEADHPCDPRLPPEELVNCHCWLTPVVGDDFQLDPARIWEGQ